MVDDGDKVRLQARDLTRRYRNGGIAGLSLSVEAGEILGIVGPNGAGKSTALGLLAARLAPDTGGLHVDGIAAARHPGRVRARVGYLGHHPPLYDDMRVTDFLTHAARLHGVPRRRLTEAVSRAMASSAVEGMAGRRIRNLSQGYRQRVGLAQAVVHDPAALILDEPTAGLDRDAAAAFIERLGPLAAERAVVLASHLFGELDRLCARVAVVHHGQLAGVHQLVGTASDDPEAVIVRLRDTDDDEPDAEAFGIAGVTALGGGRFHIPGADDATRRRVLATVLERGWSLAEWMPPRGMTEQLYRAVTEAEA